MARYRANLLSRIRFQAKWDALKILDTEHFLWRRGGALCRATSQNRAGAVPNRPHREGQGPGQRACGRQDYRRTGRRWPLLHQPPAGHRPAQAAPSRDPAEVQEAHVRRLEVLRRTGIVERLAEDVWQLLANLPTRGRQYDTQRTSGVAVELNRICPTQKPAYTQNGQLECEGQIGRTATVKALCHPPW